MIDLNNPNIEIHEMLDVLRNWVNRWENISDYKFNTKLSNDKVNQVDNILDDLLYRIDNFKMNYTYFNSKEWTR